MSHPNTQALIEYWQARKIGAQAPARAAIDPAEFPTLLPQVFMLGREGPGRYLFRLAGGLVADLHKRDLRGVEFTTLWAMHGRLPLQTAMEKARRLGEPLRFTAQVQAGPHAAPLEMVLLPLLSRDGAADRFIGLYQPTGALGRLRGLPADRLVLTAFAHEADAGPQPYLRLAAVGGQRVG